MKKTSLTLAFALVLIAIPIATHAFELKTSPSIYVAEDEIIIGNFYAAGNNITIDGMIDGDIFVAGQNFIFNGSTTGDIFVAGQSITINGHVGSSLRAVGDTININNDIAGSVHAFGASITQAKNTTVNGDFFLGAAFGEFRGKIDGDLHGGGATLVLAGEITGDVKMRLDERIEREGKGIKMEKDDKYFPLYVSDTAIIGGDLNYSAGQAGEISDDAQIAGEIGYSAPDIKSVQANILNEGWGALFSIFSSFVVGLVLISLWREKIKDLTAVMQANVWPSIGRGVLLMFVTPFVIILLLLTIIGIPLAIMLTAVWLIAMCIGKIIVGILVGQIVLNKIWEKKKDSLIWAMIIGVIIVWLLTNLPFIGWLLCFAAIWWALGGMWMMRKKA